MASDSISAAFVFCIFDALILIIIITFIHVCMLLSRISLLPFFSSFFLLVIEHYCKSIYANNNFPNQLDYDLYCLLTALHNISRKG